MNFFYLIETKCAILRFTLRLVDVWGVSSLATRYDSMINSIESNIFTKQSTLIFLCTVSAFVVRYMTKRYIEDYDRNKGE